MRTDSETNPGLTEPALSESPSLRRLITIPNLLSLSRIFLLPLTLLLLIKRQSIPALSLMLVSWATDALDGYLARRLNQVSDLGRVLDHLVDKIWVGSVLVTLVYLSGLPIYIAAAAILRDMLILAGSLVIMKTRGSLVSSDVLGKITGCAFALLMVYYILVPAEGNSSAPTHLAYLRTYKPYVDYTVAVLIVVSFLNYLAVYLKKMGKFRLPGENNHSTKPGD
ncbi:MAG: CDP-alcohol phosphatidyltransferase family protein [candidate division WOR-3 bacterium]